MLFKNLVLKIVVDLLSADKRVQLLFVAANTAVCFLLHSELCSINNYKIKSLEKKNMKGIPHKLKLATKKCLTELLLKEILEGKI